MIKSVRGSDPDAALYWMARMLVGGEPADFIARRLVILASEDIGNANPMRCCLPMLHCVAYKSIGMPEARIIWDKWWFILPPVPKAIAPIKPSMRRWRWRKRRLSRTTTSA